MVDTIEKLTCDTILQNPITITVLGKEYKVAPPSVATLIEVSKYIAQIPEMNVNEKGNVLTEVLASAKDCDCFGKIAAILILGKKNLVSRKKYRFGIFSREENNVEKLADELILNLSAEELNGLIQEIFKTLRVDFFFAVSIFLQNVNQLRKTKENETTASGLK